MAEYNILNLNNDCNEHFDKSTCKMNCKYRRVLQECKCRLGSIHADFVTNEKELHDDIADCSLKGLQECNGSRASIIENWQSLSLGTGNFQ